jgi:hypothetical protein
MVKGLDLELVRVMGKGWVMERFLDLGRELGLQMETALESGLAEDFVELGFEGKRKRLLQL